MWNRNREGERYIDWLRVGEEIERERMREIESEGKGEDKERMMVKERWWRGLARERGGRKRYRKCVYEK